MKRVYIAGAYSADNVLDILDNMRRGMREGTICLLEGNAPFVPWFDYHFQLMLKEGETLTIKHYYEYALAWLEVSDEIWVLPNSKKSKGTQVEIKRAIELKIPVFYIVYTKLHEHCGGGTIRTLERRKDGTIKTN